MALADLWSFTGETQVSTHEACMARAGRITTDVERLDKWLAAWGDSQIPVSKIRAPAGIVPGLLQAQREQRDAVSLQVENVPARVKVLRQQPGPELEPVLDRIDFLYRKAAAAQRASGGTIWQGAEGRKVMRSLLDEIRNAVKILEGRT